MARTMWLSPCGEQIAYGDDPAGRVGHFPTLTHLEMRSLEGGSHWFSPSARRWFGAQRRELIGGCVVIELQTRAPEGVGRYRATLFDSAGQAIGSCCHKSRESARRCARKMAAGEFTVEQ